MLKQVLAVLVLAGVMEGASIEKARMLNIHGLQYAAKQELIDVIYGASGAETKVELPRFGGEFRACVSSL